MNLAALVAATSVLAAPLPEHEPGDAFVYSDGRVERVLEVEEDRIRWGGLSESSHWRARNPIVPIIAWSGNGVTGRRRVIGDADRLWPLSGRRTVRFSVVTETRRRTGEPWNRTVAMWTCRSGKPTTTEVPAGAFAVIPIACDRVSTTTMKIIERQTWAYAPELQHYVRRTTLNYARAESRTIELVAALHGPSASRERLRAIARTARDGAKAPAPTAR